jgi:hypothetical protein
MKKSILALGAAAAVAGFAGVAHAEGFIGAGTGSSAPTAATVALAANGVGHYLFQPYFTTQGDNNTLLSVVNTDAKNGKAVKVRFRGAANSDDVMDFTVFLSPGDVWTASLTQGADGLSQITTPDNSCTLPQVIKGEPFATFRLQAALTDAQKAEHTREGYVEILNMADVPEFIGAAKNPLFTNIKHKLDKNGKNGVAPCDYAAFGRLTNTGWTDAAGIQADGLAGPTGGLMGGWQIVKLSNISTYSGNHVAISANTAAGAPGVGNIVFSPQKEDALPAKPTNAVTADPLLTSGAVKAAYMDLPDMSTPLVAGANADTQALLLSGALAKGRIMNEFVSTVAGAPVPGNTDWVVSQPTRRYAAALQYGKLGSSTRVLNVTAAFGDYYNPGNTSIKIDGKFGDVICTDGALSGTDREESRGGVSFSPRNVPEFCGEVFVLSFNDNGAAPSKVLSANLTKQTANIVYTDKSIVQAGWAQLSFNNGAVSTWKGLPVTGFAATSLVNQAQNGNYGYTLPHRW